MDLLNEAVSIYRSLGKEGLVMPETNPDVADHATAAHPLFGFEGFSRLPAELVVSILASCDNINDVVALVSTSKSIREIYVRNAAQVIWPVALCSFMAFDLAVLAARVTRKASDAYNAGRLPHPKDLFPIDKLSPFRRAPTVSELKEAFSLDHFARCFFNILDSNSREQLDLDTDAARGWDKVWAKTLRYRNPGPWFSLLKRLAKERITRSLYRVVIWGAVMSRAYQAPLFDAAGSGLEDLVDTWTYSLSGDAKLQWDGVIRKSVQLSAEHHQHLLKYPVYRFNTRTAPYTRDETAEFSSFMDWLLEDTSETQEKERLMQRTEHKSISERTHALPVEEQVAQIAWVSQVLKNIIVDAKGRLRARFDTPLPFIHSPEGFEDKLAEVPQVRKLTLILPGVYQPEEITMPAQVGNMIEIPSLEVASAGFKGVKKYTRLLFVSEPTSKIPCGVAQHADCQSRYIAFPSLLARASDPLPTSPIPKRDTGKKLNVEHRPLAYLLQKHFSHRAPARFLENITTNLTSLGENLQSDTLYAGVRWYKPPRPIRQAPEETEETTEEMEEIEEVEEEETKEMEVTLEKMEFCEECEATDSECEHD
ncbi:hypothetical protein QBC43DRAFT_300786 [Cladorrhinum sp. PSN259]|nr:hypothetical protein QBC43DRAFT_300786 [Cladorrhinum sp. PSN259]